MNDKKLIIEKYNESVLGINEKIISSEKDWYSHVISLPIHLRVVYTIVILHQQVYNGGFDQYFFNGYGLFGYLTLDSYEIINANLSMSLLEKVLNKVNSENLNVEIFRKKVFNKELNNIVNSEEELTNFLEKCDDEYYEIGEEVIELLENYLKDFE